MIQVFFIALAHIQLADQRLDVVLGEDRVQGAIGLYDLGRERKRYVPHTDIGECQLGQAHAVGDVAERGAGPADAVPGGVGRTKRGEDHGACLNRFSGQDAQAVGVALNAVVGFDLLLELRAGVTQQRVFLTAFGDGGGIRGFAGLLFMDQPCCGQPPLRFFIVGCCFEPVRQLLLKQVGIARTHNGRRVHEPARVHGLFDPFEQPLRGHECCPCEVIASGFGAGMQHVVLQFLD